MPFPTLRSRPGTRDGRRRPNSVFEYPPKTKDDGQLQGDDNVNAQYQHRRSSSYLSGEKIPTFPKQQPEAGEVLLESPQHTDSHGKNTEETTGQLVPTTDATTVDSARNMEDAQKNESSPKLVPEVEANSNTVKPQRFSLMRVRHASDPQLSIKFKALTPASPIPRPPTAGAEPNHPPTIITTAPTGHDLEKPAEKKKSKNVFTRAQSPFRRLQLISQDSSSGQSDANPKTNKISAASTPNLRRNPMSLDEKRFRPTIRGAGAPPAYGDESSSLAIPVTRFSESSRSDGSSGDHKVYAQTTTTHTISTTTTFFKLKRRKKDKGPLFPLPERFPKPSSDYSSISREPQDSASERRSMSPSRGSHVNFGPVYKAGEFSPSSPSPTNSTIALTNAPYGVPSGSILRKQSTLSNNSGSSTPPISLIPPRLGARGRSSTMGSLGKSSEKLAESIPQSGSPRTSTSTGGRKSFGDLLSLPHRLRQNSTPPVRFGTSSTPGTPGSKSNSLQIARDLEPELSYPKRVEGDTPASYIEKLEATIPRGVLATILCKTPDDFYKTCLRKYMRGFAYFGDSIDMAIRKMLMEVELPKETQQIDRLLASFADRYYECNPGIFASTDETSFIAFSILLLHSDTHNKNNKRKMQKLDYIKNTQQGSMQVSSDVLDCFYDNVSYTPFIHFDDEVAINSHRLSVPKVKKNLIRTKSSDNLRGPVDPYTLILDNKLSLLRPSLKEVIDMEDPYRSIENLPNFDTNILQRAFLSSSTLQIVSARSRPDAFANQATISNPAEAQAGIVSIKVAKVGLLWRKDPKKKKAKRPWQEWGVILTDSKLYFFRDDGWVKKLISQYENHSRAIGKSGGTLIFKPPLTSFEPDALMAMDDTVALTDAKYKRHKNAFVFVKHGGFEETFLANTEADMYDWIAKLNYAATFRTVGIRMRGILSASQEIREMRRTDSEISTKSVDAAVKSVQAMNGKADPQAAWEIMFYRRQLINEKLSDFDEKLAQIHKELDGLLRNARHLLILLPIQAKTREALVLAAGRMSAKLKWTRIEMWRTRTHRDILAKDLEQEGISAFPTPKRDKSATTITPAKTTQGKGRQHTPAGSVIEATKDPLSPSSTNSDVSRRPSRGVLEKMNKTDGENRHSIVNGESEELSPTQKDKTGLTENTTALKHESQQDSHSLQHQPSLVGSNRSRDQERNPTSTDNPEEQVLRDAGLIGVEGPVSKHKKPEAIDAERDRVGAVSPTADFHRDKTGSVRRSLHRSLRDSHIRDLHHGHASPVHLRHKKGRESGSSIAMTEDGTKSITSDSEELRRGTGSFILHGKKASVITMSSEWQAMSNEERLRLRNSNHDDDGEEMKHQNGDEVDGRNHDIANDDDHDLGNANANGNAKENDDENAIEDGTISNISRPPTPDEGDEDDDDSIDGSGDSINQEGSLSSPTTDQFVDAKTSYESEVSRV